MLTLEIPVKPYSVNSYYYRNRSIKRREAVEWEHTIIEHLRNKEYQDKIEEFRNLFSPSKHSIEIHIKLQYPKELLYTKKHQISSKSFDISNTEKPLIDVIFLSKYSTKTSRNLEIDDKYITKMIVEKVAGKDHLITINIKLVDLPDLSDIQQP